MTGRSGSSGRAAFVCQSIGLALVFGVQVLIARLIGADSFGIFAYVNAWLVILGIAARFGLDTVTLRDGGILVAREDWSGVRALLRVAGRWVFSSGAILAVLLIAAALLIVPSAQWELRTTFVLGALVLPIQAMSSLRSSVLLALGRAWSGLGPDYLIRPVLIAAVLLVLTAFVGRNNALTAMAATLAATFMVLLIGQAILRSALPRGDVEAVSSVSRSDLLKSAATLLLFNGASQMLYQVDTIVVGALISPHSAGSYYVAKQLALVASLALIALQTTAAPRLAALQAENKTHELQKLLSAVAWKGFAFSLAYVLGVLVLGKFALSAFGPKFIDAYPALVALAVGQLCAAAGGPVGQIAAMAGLQIAGGKIYLLAALAYVLIATFVIPKFGVFGAAVTAACVTASWTTVLCVVVWRKLNVVTAIAVFHRDR
jgi:O-antigen/teichoic acid export membrane protein